MPSGADYTQPDTIITKAFPTEEDRLTLDEGLLSFIRPAKLSRDSVMDMETWLNLIIARMRRKVGLSRRENDVFDE